MKMIWNEKVIALFKVPLRLLPGMTGQNRDIRRLVQSVSESWTSSVGSRNCAHRNGFQYKMYRVVLLSHVYHRFHMHTT
jgi:hypothetical protein